MAVLRRAHEDRGSAPAEFVLVGALLALLTLSVLQVAFAVHVRNTVIDAAAEGARQASLADRSLEDGAARTRELVSLALSPGYARDVTVHRDGDSVVVTVRTPLPLLGLAGIDEALEVTGHAPAEVVRLD